MFDWHIQTNLRLLVRHIVAAFRARRPGKQAAGNHQRGGEDAYAHGNVDELLLFKEDWHFVERVTISRLCVVEEVRGLVGRRSCD